MVKSEEATCPPEPLAMVARVPQQLPIRALRDDDWTGITNSATRRKLQNRVNQRAYSKLTKFSSDRQLSQVPSLMQKLLNRGSKAGGISFSHEHV